MITSVVFLPLVSGYIFVMNFRPISYRVRKKSSYHVLFSSASYGFLFFIICICVSWWQSGIYPEAEWGHLFGFPWLLPSAGSVLLSASLAFALNLSFSDIDLSTRSARIRNDRLEILLIESLKHQIPVAISLKSGKVYIGYNLNVSDQRDEERKYINILPVFSGFRDPVTKRLEITTNYALAIENQKYELAVPYDIILPVAEIESVRFHDQSLALGFREQEGPENKSSVPRKRNLFAKLSRCFFPKTE